MSIDTWQDAERLAQKHTKQGTGLFVRLTNDGDKIVGAFCGQPYAREVVWVSGHYENYNPHAHEGLVPSLKVMLNFYVPAEKDMKIIEGGSGWFKNILAVRDKYGLDKWLFEIVRRGKAGDKKTTYSILPEKEMSFEDRAAIKMAGLHELSQFADGGPERSPEPAESYQNSYQSPEMELQAPLTSAGRTITDEEAHDIVNRLRNLSKPAVQEFFRRMKVKRVRDILADDWVKVEETLEALRQ